jgi:hypothetical protein
MRSFIAIFLTLVLLSAPLLALSPAQKQKKIGNLSAKLIRLKNQQKLSKGPKRARLKAEIHRIELELKALRSTQPTAPPPPPKVRPGLAK